MNNRTHTYLLHGLTVFTLLYLLALCWQTKSRQSPLISSVSPNPSYCAQQLQQDNPRERTWRVNTSNPSKRAEFTALFAEHGLRLAGISSIDLPEIASTALDVVIHKASQLDEEGVIVEDSSLDVEGAQVGINIKWLVDRLPSYIGRQAKLTALMAYRLGDYVYVFKGETEGRLVPPRGEVKEGSPLNAYFLPAGSVKTLAEENTERVNPRAHAFSALLNKQLVTCLPAMRHWAGAWQQAEGEAPASLL